MRSASGAASTPIDDKASPARLWSHHRNIPCSFHSGGVIRFTFEYCHEAPLSGATAPCAVAQVNSELIRDPAFQDA